MSLVRKHPMILRLIFWIGFMARYIYRYPLVCSIILGFLGQIYLINDVSVVNDDVLSLLWSIDNELSIPDKYSVLLSKGIVGVKSFFDISATMAAYVVMIAVYTLIITVMLLLSKQLGLSLTGQWSLLFLLLCHPLFNDYRSIISVEPFYWLFLLTAILILFKYYRSNTLATIISWFICLFMATIVSFSAWFWLLFFPFGAFFLKSWRRRSVVYALGGYSVMVLICLFIPYQNEERAINELITIFNAKSESLKQLLSINNTQVINQNDWMQSVLFLITGAISLTILRIAISLTIINTILVVYAWFRKQYVIIDKNIFRMLVYAIGFDMVVAIWYFLTEQTKESPLFFSTALFLLLFAALGLSRLLRKIQLNKLSRLKVLLVVWCMVAYFASGYIIFGPKKDYFKRAGTYIAKHYNKDSIFSNSSLLLFNINKNPNMITSVESATYLSGAGNFYYVFSKHRKAELPYFLKIRKPLVSFFNPRGDSLLIYHLKPGG